MATDNSKLERIAVALERLAEGVENLRSALCEGEHTMSVSAHIAHASATIAEAAIRGNRTTAVECIEAGSHAINSTFGRIK